ncbi:unnamed protein product, partial [Prunus brigantina]
LLLNAKVLDHILCGFQLELFFTLILKRGDGRPRLLIHEYPQVCTLATSVRMLRVCMK